MKSFSRICLGVLALCALSSLPARAVSGSSDYSGLWYNASENGWGMNVIQQEQILFITLFIYGANNQPTWFVASSTTFASASGGDRTYTGPLYATTGTPFSTNPFNPASVTVAQVGTITFVGKADGTATVSYTASGSTVNKTVVRQTWAQPQFTLNVATPYTGANSSTATGCTVASNNGPSNGTFDQMALYINGSAMRLELTTPPTDAGNCAFQASNYVQEGRYGKATMTGTCSAFPAGTPPIQMVAREVEVGPNSFTFQYTVTGGPTAGCVETGVFVGARK
jgi:hypothetical protein